MAAADLKHTLEQLVEADRDRNDAARAISDYQAKATEPAPPPVFEDLDALLDFYLRRQEYYHGLQHRQDAQRVAADAYENAAERLSKILPNSSRLFYTYPGNRKDLRGATFAIENQNAKIMISSSSGPGGSGTVPSVFRFRFSSQNLITKGLRTSQNSAYAKFAPVLAGLVPQ
jgi:hypothetical protein